jgi:hypothetical protein
LYYVTSDSYERIFSSIHLKRYDIINRFLIKTTSYIMETTRLETVGYVGDMSVSKNDTKKGYREGLARDREGDLFRTMRSRAHDVVLVRGTIDLRCWEFGMGREWGGGG